MPVRVAWPRFRGRWPMIWAGFALPLVIAVYALAEAGLVIAAALIPRRRAEAGYCVPSWLPDESAGRVPPCDWVQESGPVAALAMVATGLLVLTAVLMQTRARRSSRTPEGVRASLLQALGALLCLAAASGVLVFGYGPYPA